MSATPCLTDSPFSIFHRLSGSSSRQIQPCVSGLFFYRAHLQPRRHHARQSFYSEFLSVDAEGPSSSITATVSITLASTYIHTNHMVLLQNREFVRASRSAKITSSSLALPPIVDYRLCKMSVQGNLDLSSVIHRCNVSEWKAMIHCQVHVQRPRQTGRRTADSWRGNLVVVVLRCFATKGKKRPPCTLVYHQPQHLYNRSVSSSFAASENSIGHFHGVTNSIYASE